MTWTDDAKQKFEQAMEQFKGNRYPCRICGMKGEYDKELDPCLTNIGRFGVLQGDTYTASIESSFMCKDREACDRRRESNAQ